MVTWGQSVEFQAVFDFIYHEYRYKSVVKFLAMLGLYQSDLSGIEPGAAM